MVAGIVVIAAKPAWLLRGWDSGSSAFRSDENAVAARLAWEVGIENRYLFHLETAVKHGPSRADLMDVKLQGQLAIAALEPGVLRLQFTGDAVELAGVEASAGSGAQDDNLSNQLKAPFHAYFDARGRLIEVKTAPRTYEFVTRLWHGTVAALQFVGRRPSSRIVGLRSRRTPWANTTPPTRHLLQANMQS